MPENTQAGTFPMGGVNGEQLFAYYNAGKPTYVRELAKRFGLQFDPFHNWLAQMGLDEPVDSNGVWYAYEENRIMEVLKVLDPVSSTGAGTTVTFQLDPTMITQDMATGVYGFYGRETEIVTIPGTRVQAQIISISGSGTLNVFITLKPLSATSDIGTLTAGMELPITNQAVASGMGMPGGVVKGATRRDFGLQIFTEQAIAEGRQVGKSKWYEAYDNAGQPMGFVTDITNDALYRLNKKINGAYLFGQVMTNGITQTTRYGVVNPVNTFEGLDPAIARLGATSVVTPGAFNLDDLYDWGDYGLAQGVSSNIYMLAVGSKLRHDIDKAANAFIQGNGTDLTSAVTNFLIGGSNGDAMDKLLSLGFKELEFGQNRYLLKTIEELSDPKGLGAVGQNNDKCGWVIPISNFKDPVSGNSNSTICTKYVDKNGYSRKLEMFMTAGAGGQKIQYVHEFDDFAINIRADRGLQLLKLNQFRRLTL